MSEEVTIQYEDVHKRFDTPVLSGVSLSVMRGETISILGTSGTGKSVLLKTTIGLITPDRGDVRIDGVSVTRVGVEQRQDPDLATHRQLTVYEVHCPNVMRSARRRTVLAKLRLDPPTRRLLAQLQAHLAVDPANTFVIERPAFTHQQHVHAPVAVPHAFRADLLDPRLESGLSGAPGSVAIRGWIELQKPTGSLPRRINGPP